MDNKILLVCDACGDEWTPEEGHKECSYYDFKLDYKGHNSIQEGLDSIDK